MKKPISLRLDVELLKAVDGARGSVGRTAFVERALWRAVEGKPVGPMPSAPQQLGRLERERLAKFRARRPE